jgi:8-oxo-dGTP diphosphatase
MPKAVQTIILVRAVVKSNGQVLLARRPGAQWTFLPGGHVEKGESLPCALDREIREELGAQFRIDWMRYLGEVEAHWKDGDLVTYEINHVFGVDIPHLHSGMDVKSSEDNLEFVWANTTSLSKHNLLPRAVESLVMSKEQLK